MSLLAPLYVERLRKDPPILDPKKPKYFFAKFPTYMARAPGASDSDRLLPLEMCLPKAVILELQIWREKAAQGGHPVSFEAMFKWIKQTYPTLEKGTTTGDH